MNLPLLTVCAWPLIAGGFTCFGISVLTKGDPFLIRVGLILNVIGMVLAFGGVVQIFAHGPQVHLG